MLATGMMVGINEVANGLECGCVCAACRAPLIARQGAIRRWHFSHAPGFVACETGAETALHRMAKQIIAQWDDVTLPPLEVRVSQRSVTGQTIARDVTIPETRFVAEKGVIEARCDGFVPDVLLHGPKGELLAIEVCVTHKVSRAKQQRVAEHALPMIQFSIDLADDSSAEAAELEQRLRESTPEWIFHPKEAELRLQLEADKAWDGLVLKYRGDFIGDGVLEEGDFDLRELSLTFSPASFVDVRVGRQVLTWGTGDLLFVNDLFPKDWQAFLSGRDVEYLKAPSDAIRTTWFTDWVNIDFVYTPQFDHDRFITGERMSFYNSLYGRTVGADREVNFNAPSTWFEDDEYALRLYRMVGSAELAFYAYSGYWKSPGGQRFPPMQATFPKLSVYGASLRGNFLNGIGNVELAYYDSRQDRGGDNPFVNNSEFRLLLGYERELAKELTGSVQYYLEHMMDYGAYRNSLIPLIMDARDQDRHLFTVRLTKLLMRQDLTLSLFAFFSPSDVDTYLRPQVSYKVNDQWTVECGGNVFFGEKPSTFFGQFEDNTNVYGAVRYSF